MFKTAREFDDFLEKYWTELKFMNTMIEQGKDAYPYLLSVVDEGDMDKVGFLIAANYAGTTMQELAEITLADRFPFKMEEFIDIDS